MLRTPRAEPDVVILDDRELDETIFSPVFTYCAWADLTARQHCAAWPAELHRRIPKTVWQGSAFHIRPIGAEQADELGQPIVFRPAAGVVCTSENEQLLAAYEAASRASANKKTMAGVEAERQLLSAREAALLLGVVARTAQLRARQALRGGDQAVRWIAGAYCVPIGWWRELLARPIRPGRPRTARA